MVGPVIRRFLLKLLVNAAAVWAADYLLSGFSVMGGPAGYLIAGALLAVLNTFARPILKLLALPLIAVSFGLFTFVINAAILWFVAHTLDQVAVSGLVALTLATCIVSVVNLVFNRE